DRFVLGEICPTNLRDRLHYQHPQPDPRIPPGSHCGPPLPGGPIGCRSPRKRGPYSMPIHRRTPTIPFGSNVGSKLRTNRSPKTAEIVVRHAASENVRSPHRLRFIHPPAPTLAPARTREPDRSDRAPTGSPLGRPSPAGSPGPTPFPGP